MFAWSNGHYVCTKELMMMRIRTAINWWFVCVTCVFAVCVQAADLVPVPPLTAPVMDTAEMMQPAQRQALNQHLLNFSQQKGSQIIVLTVPVIKPETPFDYATRVMDTWKPGRKGIDDGVLLLLVRDEHETFLAVGRGLEGVIPDIYAKQILDETLSPQLQQGHTDQGIEQAVNQIEKLINGEKLPPAKSTTSINQNQNPLQYSFAILAIITLIGPILKNIFGRILGSGLIGFGVACFGWFIGWGLLASLAMALGAGILAFVLSYFPFWYGGGGGFGGGRNSGGGFSGGGGGFGGGGASGKW